MLLLFLFVLWLIFNANPTTEVLLIGLPVSVMVWFFCLKLFDKTPRSDMSLFLKIPALLKFLFLLFEDVIRSAITVCGRILSFKEPDPCLVTVRVDLQKEVGRVLWANSITLTPGTITVNLDDNRYTVHCLDASSSSGLDNGTVLQAIRELEGGNTVG